MSDIITCHATCHIILISNTRDCVSLGYPNAKKKFENMTYSRVLFKKFKESR